MRYLWDWYFDLNQTLTRVRDGICGPIPPTEFLAWREASRLIVHGWEYATLCAMDAAYCDELNKELADRRAREAEAAERAKGRS